MEFLQSDCHTAVLDITASGSAIISELLRLANFIPDVFLFQKQNLKDKKKANQATELYMAANGKTVDAEEVKLRYAEQQKYLSIMWDLDYVANQDKYDI
jgi:hypothetical protein